MYKIVIALKLITKNLFNPRLNYVPNILKRIADVGLPIEDKRSHRYRPVERESPKATSRYGECTEMCGIKKQMTNRLIHVSLRGKFLKE